MGRREAEEERQRAATLVQQAWSGGYKRACEVGGAVFVPMAMTPYGGWHREDKDAAESWTRRTTHTGDNVGYYEFDQRFEHPGRTWASATHRAFSFACVGAAMANETWKFVQAKSKSNEVEVYIGKLTRYQRRGCAHEGDAATGGGTPCARGRHAMEPERRRH